MKKELTTKPGRNAERKGDSLDAARRRSYSKLLKKEMLEKADDRQLRLIYVFIQTLLGLS